MRVLKYHMIWCPKFRRPVLADGVATAIKRLLPAKVNEPDVTIEALEILPDQVHLLSRSTRPTPRNASSISSRLHVALAARQTLTFAIASAELVEPELLR